MTKRKCGTCKYHNHYSSFDSRYQCVWNDPPLPFWREFAVEEAVLNHWTKKTDGAKYDAWEEKDA